MFSPSVKMLAVIICIGVFGPYSLLGPDIMGRMFCIAGVGVGFFIAGYTVKELDNVQT